MPTKHALGFGNGRIVEYEDGTVAYYKTAEFTQAFRVPIAEVRGFSVVKGGKMFERTLNVMGSGTILASISIPHGVAEKIEEWFRRHPQLGDNAPLSLQQMVTAPPPEPTAAPDLLVADELRKLASLRDDGILTEDEFAARKQLLLDRSV
jgi:Short C-terminal domain